MKVKQIEIDDVLHDFNDVELEQKVQEQEAKITQNTQAVANQETKIQNAETTATENKTKIQNEIKPAIENNAGLIRSVTETATENKTKIQKNITDINQLLLLQEALFNEVDDWQNVTHTNAKDSNVSPHTRIQPHINSIKTKDRYTYFDIDLTYPYEESISTKINVSDSWTISTIDAILNKDITILLDNINTTDENSTGITTLNLTLEIIRNPQNTNNQSLLKATVQKINTANQETQFEGRYFKLKIVTYDNNEETIILTSTITEQD